MRKIYLFVLAALLLSLPIHPFWAEEISEARPTDSSSILQLDSELNFNVSIEYSDVAGGLANATIFIMITFQRDDKHVVYDAFTLKIKSGKDQESFKNENQGTLEFSVPLKEHTDVEKYEDIIEIRLFLVDALGRKSKTKSIKLDPDKRKTPQGQRMLI
ncbi:MAG: hypothetical protein CO141_03285 [Candidatus Moranbacteria bacterium CG_4_9_14_3_um_filter_42_9]|nr:MAG: hypothetical protein CO141_03285 [Candidatus Moranbacteria bacterium CG_4_9_14_3_um_filter_42_9]